VEAVTAWLQGRLIFHHERLEDIMLRVSRIYDVQVVWLNPEVRGKTFNGSVSRSRKLSTILNYFRKAGNIDFLVEGKTVKVFKKKNQ
jgi:ferric-dicitrate binding protein FerR (iron transport regulator)